jgi:GTP cyclohydrolase III
MVGKWGGDAQTKTNKRGTCLLVAGVGPSPSAHSASATRERALSVVRSTGVAAPRAPKAKAEGTQKYIK